MVQRRLQLLLGDTAWRGGGFNGGGKAERSVGGGGILTEFLLLQVAAGADFLWGAIHACFDAHGMDEVVAQVRDVFQKDGWQIQTNVVEQDEVLMQLSHVADMGHDRDAELLAQQTHGDELTNPSDAHGIDLDESSALGLEVVFENNTVGHVLAEGEFHRRNGIGQGLVAHDVVGMGGLLDPEGIDFPESGADIESLGQGPLLVGIDHDAGVIAGDLADDVSAAQIAVGVLGADFEFHRREAGIDGAFAVFAHLLVAVVEPADGGVVAGITAGEDALAGGTAGAGAGQQGQGLLRREHVLEVREIERRRHLRGTQLQQEFPQRQSARFRPQIPAGIGDRSERELDNALVGSEPAKLLLIGHFALQGAEVGHDFLDVAVHEPLGVKLGGATDEIIALAEGESEAGAGAAVVIGEQCDGVGVNGILVNGIGAVARADGVTSIAGRDAGDHGD